MTMTFSLHDSIDPNGAFDRMDSQSHSPDLDISMAQEAFHILRGKWVIRDTDGRVERPRINSILRNSLEQFPATLISGRAGSGKTALAASFVAGRENVSWFSVESTDIEWPTFSRYFSASLSPIKSGARENNSLGEREKEVSPMGIARFLLNRFSFAYSGVPKGSSLMVLDDIHHIFDAPWFDDFFNLLLHSLPPETHLLLLCRSRPPSPLWRLRSKQILNVLDERLIAFNAAETEALFSTFGLSPTAARKANSQCFGRISKLLQFAGHSATPTT